MFSSKFKCADELTELFADQDPFEVIDNLPGEVFRQLEQRKTQSFQYQQKNYFFKVHNGMSWAECFKNLLQLKLPVISAVNEWRALSVLEKHGVGVPRPVVYADQMGWPPSRRSFIVMEAIENFIQVDHVFSEGHWQKLSRQQQDTLIIEVARMTRAMFQLGINHRDCYLCHFLLDKNWLADPDGIPAIHLIDFHRARIKKPLPEKWQVKDLGGLYYSAIDFGLNKRQLWLFIKTCQDYESPAGMRADLAFWRQVAAKAAAIYQRDFNKTAPVVFGD